MWWWRDAGKPTYNLVKGRLCCLEGLRATPRWPGRQGSRDREGWVFTGERSSSWSSGWGTEPRWNFSCWNGRIQTGWGSQYGWCCLQRHLQAVRGITSPRTHIFLRMEFRASWVEDVSRDWVFRCDSSASFITVPWKAMHTPAPEIPLADQFSVSYFWYDSNPCPSVSVVPTLV